jgi:hypothetical protein
VAPPHSILPFTLFAAARRGAENPRLLASADVVSSLANAPDRQGAAGIVHIDAMSFIPTSPHERSRPELSLRVDAFS